MVKTEHLLEIMNNYTVMKKNKYIFYVPSILCFGLYGLLSSCGSVYDCPEFDYNNGWLRMESIYNHTYELTYIENCFANGPSIIFYDSSGIIKEYGTVKDGKRIGKWYHYNEVGELTSVSEHNIDK